LATTCLFALLVQLDTMGIMRGKILLKFRAGLHWCKRSYKNGWFIATAGLVLTGLLILITLLARSHSKTPTYQESLNTLVANVEALQNSLEVPIAKDIGSDLETYQKRLNGLDVSCNELVRLKQPGPKAEDAAAGERVKGICVDVMRITHYSRLLHERIANYILLDDAAWPQAGSKEFDIRLEKTMKVIADTVYELEGLDNKKVQDPALDELIYQVKLVQNIAQKVKDAQENSGEASLQAEELRKTLSRDKTDFLAARQYFWNNTVGIAKLHEAVLKIQIAVYPIPR
jgi:hypothetical protein